MLKVNYMTVVSFTVTSHVHDEAKERDWKLCLFSEIKLYVPYAKSNEEETLFK